MPKNSNNLNNRREFYIHQIVRNGRTSDDDTYRNVDSREDSIKESSYFKEKVSVAETFGYRADPKRYDSLRDKPMETIESTNVSFDTQEKEYVEEPISDDKSGYYDEGVEVVDDFLDANDIDDLYQETFNTYEPAESFNSFEQVEKKSSFEPIVNNEQALVREHPYIQKIQEASVDKRETTDNPKAEQLKNNFPNIFSNKVPSQKAPLEKPKVVKKAKYVAPPLDLLKYGSKDSDENKNFAEQQVEVINRTFKESNIRASVADYIFGPTVTQFMIKIEEGANVKDIRKVESNLLMYLQAPTIRIQTPIPGKPFAGIEVPKKQENRRTVLLGDMLASKEFKNSKLKVPVAVGEDNFGNYNYIDLTEMPHALVAGTTKSGKSVSLNTFLFSLIYHFTPDELRLVLIDPKRVEFGPYSDIPHLAMPIIIDQEDFQSALNWVCDEMERRYELFAVNGDRSIVNYNISKKQSKEPTLPYIILIMDEFSDWFTNASSDIELYMQRLAQKARAAGIHIILAAQRPSKDIIKGSIKANFDTRIAFRTSSFEDAKVILGSSGAEKLEGYGDMLIRYAGRPEQRLQGAFLSDEEISKVTTFLRENNTCDYIVTKEEIHQSTLSRQTSSTPSRNSGRYDERFEEIAYWVVRNKNASVNQITQIFGMGFNRVNDIIIALEQMNVISMGVKGKQREVLIDEFQLTSLLEDGE